MQKCIHFLRSSSNGTSLMAKHLADPDDAPWTSYQPTSTARLQTRRFRGYQESAEWASEAASDHSTARSPRSSTPADIDTTLDALEVSAPSTDDAGHVRAYAARRRVAECDTRLGRYRAVLQAGTDPVVVSAWIAEVQAERLAVEVELERPTGQRNQRMTRDQLALR